MSTRVEHEVSDSESSSDVLEEFVPWDESRWICPSNPRIYPAKDVPPEVERRRKFLLELPDDTKLLLPPNRLSITRLLAWPYNPKPRQGLAPTPVRFTNDSYDPNPFAIIRALERRLTYPPLRVINELEKELGPAWFNGNTALQDDYYESYPLPFWSITLWKRFDHMHSIRSRWFVAESTLASYKHKDRAIDIAIRQVADRITTLMQQIAWYAPVCGYPTMGWRPETTHGTDTLPNLIILMLSLSPRSPLYQRDVWKVDRQDDLAALRLFSSIFIQFILEIAQEQIDNKPFQMAPLSHISTKDLPEPSVVLQPKNLVALAIWLFVFGDAFDAFQSRSLPIYDRVLMVLRLHFFLEIWKSSLNSLGYSETLHFISRKYYEIIRNLVDGFLSLVIVYRDTFEGAFALSPWLHSTEGNEHTFGEARRIKPDFTVSDFLSLVPKLEASSLSALHDADLERDLKIRAAGYHHTLYSRLGIDMTAMSSFPPDSLLSRASRIAYEEASTLFSRCQIVVTPALCPPPPSSGSAVPSPGREFVAPGIREWFQEEEDELDTDGEDDSNLACELEDEPLQLAGEIEKLLREANSRGCAPLDLDKEMNGYAAAAVALEAEDEHQLMNTPDRDEQGGWESTRQHLQGALKLPKLPPLVIAENLNYRSLLGDETRINLPRLVETRSANESRFAKKSVRVGTGVLKPEVSITTVSDDSVDGSTTLSTGSARTMLAKRIHGALNRFDAAGVVSTSGASRISRHEGRFETEASQSGNAANATAAAKARDSTALTKRRNAFRAAKLKSGPLIEAAGVSSIVRISTGSLAFVLVEDQVWLAEVLTMYSKSAGKGGKHSWVNDSANIASLSGVVVQLWEHWAGREFNIIPQKTVKFFAHRFAHIPPARVLYVAANDLTYERLENNNRLLSRQFHALWTGFTQEKAEISVVIVELLKRSRKPRETELTDD